MFLLCCTYISIQVSTMFRYLEVLCALNLPGYPLPFDYWKIFCFCVNIDLTVFLKLPLHTQGSYLLGVGGGRGKLPPQMINYPK